MSLFFFLPIPIWFYYLGLTEEFLGAVFYADFRNVKIPISDILITSKILFYFFNGNSKMPIFLLMVFPISIKGVLLNFKSLRLMAVLLSNHPPYEKTNQKLAKHQYCPKLLPQSFWRPVGTFYKFQTNEIR